MAIHSGYFIAGRSYTCRENNSNENHYGVSQHIIG
jgi:hypothetical protein